MTDEPGEEDMAEKDDQHVNTAAMPTESDLSAEERQAMEMMLRQVEDDPGGLLRQRFLLQQLRREGKL